MGAVAGNVAIFGAGGYMLARKGNIPIQRYIFFFFEFTFGVVY